MPFAQKHIGFEKPPRLFLKQDPTNAKDPLGKTAYYDPAEMSVTLYTTDRHPKDILRSLGHELVHHKQNCEGKFDDVGEMGEGYAQTNPHLRQMEVEANRDGSMCLRDFTDTLMRENTIYFEHLQKGDTNMSTKDWKNGELKGLLTEAWGFQMDLSKLNEGEKPDGDGDGVPPWADKDDEDADVQEEGVMDLMRKAGRRIPKGRNFAYSNVMDALTVMYDHLPGGTNQGSGGPPRLQYVAKEADVIASPAAELSPEIGKMADELNAYVSQNYKQKDPEVAQNVLQMVDQLKARLADYNAGKKMEEVVEEEEVVKEEFPGESDMNTHKRDLSEARLKEIIAYALKTKG